MTHLKVAQVVFLSMIAVLSIISCEEDSLVELDRIPDITLYDTTMTNCSKTFRVRIEVDSKTEKLYYQLAVLQQGQEEPLKKGFLKEVPPNTPRSLLLELEVVQADNIQPGEYQMVILVFKDADKATNDSDPFSLSNRFLVDHVLYVYIPSFPLCDDSCTCTERVFPRAYAQLQVDHSVPDITSVGGDYLIRYGDICCTGRPNINDMSIVFGSLAKTDATALFGAIWAQFGYGVLRDSASSLSPGGSRYAYIELMGKTLESHYVGILPALPEEGDSISYEIRFDDVYGNFVFLKNGDSISIGYNSIFHSPDWVGKKGDFATWGGEVWMREAILAGKQDSPSRICAMRIGVDGLDATVIDSVTHLVNYDDASWYLDTLSPSIMEFWAW